MEDPKRSDMLARLTVDKKRDGSTVWRIHTRPMYLSPIYGNMREKRKQMMQPMTARAILPQVQGRWTVSSWFPHFEHL